MTLLTVNHLTKKYERHLAVNEVNFQLQAGQCVSLLGPNGAGKTTILRMLAGLLTPTSGTISFNQMKKSDDIRSLIGYLPQYPAFYTWMTGIEFLTYAGELAYLSSTESRKRAEILLEKVGIYDARNRRIGKYSGGMKQRLGIAQATIHEPKLLILDEPVSSLDPIGRREVLTLMEDLKKDMSILFSTHILTDAEEISDELLLINKGNIVESGSMDVLMKKYETKNIELRFENNVEFYEEKLKQFSSVTQTFIKGNKVNISSTNIIDTRTDILTIAGKEKWPLTNFSVNQVSLEDMFMKVVK